MWLTFLSQHKSQKNSFLKLKINKVIDKNFTKEKINKMLSSSWQDFLFTVTKKLYYYHYRKNNLLFCGIICKGYIKNAQGKKIKCTRILPWQYKKIDMRNSLKELKI